MPSRSHRPGGRFPGRALWLALLWPCLTLAAPPAAAPASAPAAPPLAVLQPDQVQALGVRAEVAQADAVSAQRYPAQVVVPAAQQQVLAAPLPGLVTELRVAAGDAVQAGQVLAVLRSPQALELQRDVGTTDSQAALAASALQRDEALYKEGLIALSRLEATRAQARQTALQRDERRRALAEAGLGAAGGAGRAPGGTLLLRSPLTGVVLERPVAIGQRVDAATTLLRVARLAPLWLELQVPARDAAQFQVGDAVTVVGTPAHGRVIALGHAVDAASQTVLVRAHIQGGNAALRVGQAVEALHSRAVAGVLRVPAAALLVEAGRPQVLVEAAPGQYRAVEVEPLGEHGGQVALRGLPAGARVVVHGTAALKALLAAAR